MKRLALLEITKLDSFEKLDDMNEANEETFSNLDNGFQPLCKINYDCSSFAIPINLSFFYKIFCVLDCKFAQ